MRILVVNVSGSLRLNFYHNIKPFDYYNTMSWIAPRLTDGLCNRLFQIVGANWHAKKNGSELVFYVPRVQPSVHSDCTLIFKMFPEIRNVWSVKEHDVAKENASDFALFKELSIGGKNTVIEGYFQNWSYFEGFKKPDICRALTELELKKYTIPPDFNPQDMWWIHVRLGDYMNLPHHQCATKEYWLAALQHIPKNAIIIVFSDTLDVAMKLIGDCGRPDAMPSGPELSAITTLYLMSQCGGGCIGTNSTFSWWGMYLSLARERGAPCILPSRWHKNFEGGPYAPWITLI
jgi:hypothetical protein